LVAIVILLIAVAGALSTQMEALDLLHDSEETSTAMVDLQTVMEEILLRIPDEIPGAFPEGVAIDVLDNVKLQDEVVTPEYPAWDFGGVVPDPLEVRLTINWSSHRGQPRSLSLSTMKSK
jgi:hypothetical protein